MPSKVFLNLDKDKKERIINAAINEFRIKKFEDAKVVSICKKADIPRVTFYSYFSSLEDVYEYVYGYYSEKCMEETKEKELNCTLDCNFDDVKYFLKLLESEKGMKELYNSFEGDCVKNKIINHLSLSLSFKYKLGLINEEEFTRELNIMIKNIK